MNQPRRILHVISRLDGYGGARPLVDLASDQAARGDRPMVAALTATNEAANRLRDADIEVQIFGDRWPLDGLAAARLRRWRRGVGVHLVHAWDAKALLHAAVSGGRAPLIATTSAADATLPWRDWAMAKLRRRVAAFAVSDETARTRLLARGARAEQVLLIPPGVAAPRSPACSRIELLEQLDLPPQAKLIAAAGPMLRRLCFDETIWNFELVRVLYPDARLLIIGDGPDRPRLETFASQVSEPGCVNFLGYRRDAATLLSLVDMYWQLDAPPAAAYELLEAMAAGAPIVATDAPGHRAAIRPDVNGRLAPPGNRAEVARAADELLRDAALARRLAAAAAADAAEHWSLAAALDAYERLYRRVLAPQPVESV